MSFLFSSILSIALLLSTASSAKINVDQTKLTIAKNSKSVLTFTLDEPIICPYTKLYDCSVTLLLTNPNPSKLSLDICQIEWGWKDWTQSRYVNVTAVENFINDMPFSGIIITSPVISKSEYYSGFNPIDISVQTIFKPSATCSGTGDPHYTTFDGAYWHIYWAGTYVLYKSTQRQFEIQVATRGYPSQHCGFAARENNDVVIVYACDGRMIQRRTCGSSTCQSGSFPKVSVSGSSFTVQFASGASATLNYYNSNYGNIYVTAPGQDYMSTVGVCGNFNGVSSDDIPHNNFVASSTSQMPSGTIPSYDLFNWYPSEIIDIVTQSNAYKCPYKAPVVILPILSAPQIEDITNLIKQSTQVIDTPEPIIFNIDDLITLDKNVFYATCNKTISESMIAKTCKEVMSSFDISIYIDSCTEDMFLSNGDISFIQTAIDGLTQDCKSEATRDTNTWVKDVEGNLIEPNIQIQQNACPFVGDNMCNGNGICVQAQCVCNNGYTGTDCGINRSLPPILISQSDYNCDTHGISDCPTEISIYGANFWNSPGLQCNFGIYVTNAFYMGQMQVICAVPKITLSGSQSITYQVLIQTDTNIISKSSINFTFYDGSCLKCTNNTCITNPTTCNIDGICYLDNQISSINNVCLKCKSHISTSSFTYDYSSAQDCGPQFPQSILSTKIVGSSKKGEVFYKVSAQNPLLINDSNNRLGLRYNITSGPSLFGINPITGEIFTTYDVIISELPKNFVNYIIVTVTDNVNNIATTQVIVNLIATNNNPVFNSDYYRFTINETISIGTVVGIIKAHDTDLGNFGIITYNMNYVSSVSSSGYNFELNSQTGEIISTKLLDYYVVPSYEYIAVARDGGGQYYMTHVFITLIMINKPPTSIYITNTNIKELQPVTTLVDKIQVVDREDKIFRYELNNTNFKIVNGLLYTNKIFSFGIDVNPQIVNIKVYDIVNNSYTETFKININQINRAPYNIGLSKTVFPENSKLSSILAHVTYVESNSEQKVYCSISYPTTTPFVISQNYLVVTQNLDYATNQMYNITITCMDDGFPSMMGMNNIIINITYIPKGPSEVKFLSENVPEYSPLNILVGILTIVSKDVNTTDINIIMYDDSYILNYKECLKTQPYGILCKVNVYSNTILDYENPVLLRFKVHSNNGIETDYQLDVPIKNINEHPTGINWFNNKISENGGYFTIEDPDTINNFEVTTTTPGFNISKLEDNDFKITTNIIVYEDTNYTINIIVKNDVFVNNFSTYVIIAHAPIKIWINFIGITEIQIYENQIINTKIGEIVLSNLDAKKYFYSCSSNSKYVKIFKNQVILTNKLDYYDESIISFSVNCSFVYVGQDDINKMNIEPVISNLYIQVGFIDLPPYSLSQSYVINLDKDTNFGTTLNVVPPIEVKDRENNKIIYGLEFNNQNFNDIIKINPDTGRIYVGKILSTMHNMFNKNRTISTKLRIYDGINIIYYPLTIHITDGCSATPCGTYKCIPKFKSYICDCGFGRQTTNCTEYLSPISMSTTNDKISDGSIVGIVIGTIILTALLIAIVLIMRMRQNKKINNEHAESNDKLISLENPMFIQPYAVIDNVTKGLSNPIYYGNKSFVPGMSNPLYTWYNSEYSRTESELYLQDKDIGTFIVHDSKATPGWYIFSFKNEKGIIHEKIKCSEDGFYELIPSNQNFKPQPKFYDLPTLVEYYTSSIVNPMYVINNEHVYNVVTSNRLYRVTDFNRKLYLEEDPNAPPLPIKEKYKNRLDNDLINVTLI